MNDNATSIREKILVIVLLAIALAAILLTSCRPPDRKPLELLVFDDYEEPPRPTPEPQPTPAIRPTPTPAPASRLDTGWLLGSASQALRTAWDFAGRAVRTYILPTDEPPPGLLTPIKPKPLDDSYRAAYEAFSSDHGTMVVLVGAEWCGPCKEVHGLIPQLRAKGHYAYIDLDRQPTDAKSVALDGSIPRLAVYTWVRDGLAHRDIYEGVDAIRGYVLGEPKEVSAIAGPVPAGFSYPGAHVLDSRVNVVLTEEAQQHADYQASVQHQGHQLWSQRQQRLAARLGPGRYTEICAESWPWQANAGQRELWTEMFDCWRQSSGHWQIASQLHQAYGSGMAQGRNKIWYAAIIFQDP